MGYERYFSKDSGRNDYDIAVSIILLFHGTAPRAILNKLCSIHTVSMNPGYTHVILRKYNVIPADLHAHNINILIKDLKSYINVKV